MNFEMRELTPRESLETGVLHEIKITEDNGLSWYVYECENMLQVIALNQMSFTSKDGTLTISKKEV